MEYRLVEKNGLNISALSFGCMRFEDDESAAEAVEKAVELGVNYFDVAPAYGGGRAEPQFALGLSQVDREKIIVTAKSSPGNGWADVGIEYNPATGFGIRTADQVRKQIDRSMEILGVDHLDVYHLWAVHGVKVFDEAIKPGGFLEGVAKAHEEGLFDHIGITGHFTSDELISFLQQFPFTLVTLPFNLLDTTRAKGVDYCREHGIGVIAMNPLGGGTFAKKSAARDKIASDLGFGSQTEAALRFLTSYPGVTTALCGITYASQAVEDDAAIAKGAISRKVSDELESRVKELYANVEHFCTACGYCGDCPQGILIPQVLEVYTNLMVPSMADVALQELADRLSENPEGLDPSLCTACKACEKLCPNHIPVSELMQAALDKWA